MSDLPPIGSPGLSTADSAGQRHTVACLFETRADADRAADALVADGIGHGAIEIVDQSDRTTAAGPVEGGGLWEGLKRMFTADDDTAGYYEGVNRGHSLLTVHVLNPAEADRVTAILERHDPIDLETQQAAWRESGWTGGMAPGAGMGVQPGMIGSTATPLDVTAPSAKPVAPRAATAEPMLSGRATEPRTSVGGTAGEEVIPVVEENVAVGKRPVSQGRVRVHTYVVETPVEEDVRLRDERVQVERRPVDRAEVGEDAFRERSVEMTETREEAVVGKTARVTEEVVVRKDAGERTEHVRETARRTEVRVDRDGDAGTAAPTAPSADPATPKPTTRRM